MFDLFLIFGVLLGVCAAANKQRLAKEQEDLPTFEEFYLQRQEELHAETTRNIAAILECMIQVEKDRLGPESWFPEEEKPARPKHLKLVESDGKEVN